MTQPKSIPRTCEFCQQPFMSTGAQVARGWGRFCSRSCKARSRTGERNSNWRKGGSAVFSCVECGKEVRTRAVARVASGAKKFCSRRCYSFAQQRRRAEEAPCWRGGRRVHEGRVLIYKPDHPNAQQSGCVFEHILVAERALGHVLPRGAIVHHVNENPLDNRPSNLAILPSRGYHMALHARLRVLKAGGHPHRDQICSRCKGIKPKTEFPAIPRDRERSSVWCRACNREHYRQRRDAASA